MSFPRWMFAVAFLLSLAVRGVAQTPVPAPGNGPVATTSNWAAVQALHAGDLIRIGLWASIENCSFLSADADNLICEQEHTGLFFPVRRKLLFHRKEVNTVRMSRGVQSALLGGAVLGGIGAGVGAVVDSRYSNQVEEGHIVLVLFGMTGALLGGRIGLKTDFLAGPLVYRR